MLDVQVDMEGSNVTWERQQWYLDHARWLDAVTSREYQKWISLNYQAAR